MLRTAILLLSGNAFGWLILFARNLLVARLLSVEDYGIAATFALSMAVVEMASGLGIQQLIIQDKSGEDPCFQAGLHAVHLVRSSLSAVLLFALAPLVAEFLGVPHLVWAYQLLAIIPALRGFEHFDMYRLNRQHIYLPIILNTAVPAVLSLVAVLPLHAEFGDYRVMLYAMILQWLLSVVVSHITAVRHYAVRFNLEIVRRCIQFGWPLLIGNVLLFLVLQGDKVIVAREMGMEILAIFAMGVTLTMTPMLVVAKSQQMFFLPRLSSAHGDTERFRELTVASIETSLVGGLLLVAGTVLFAKPVVLLLLSEKYAALIPLMVWLAVQQAVRSFKVGSTIAALARGHTENAMFANLVRLTVVPAAWYVASLGGSLKTLVLIGTIGELMGFFTSLWLVRIRLQVSLVDLWLPILAGMAYLTIASLNVEVSALIGLSDSWFAGVLVVLLVPVLLTMKRLRTCFRNVAERK